MDLSHRLRGFCGIWSDRSGAFADEAERLEQRIKQLEEQNAKQADKLNKIANIIEANDFGAVPKITQVLLEA